MSGVLRSDFFLHTSFLLLLHCCCTKCAVHTEKTVVVVVAVSLYIASIAYSFGSGSGNASYNEIICIDAATETTHSYTHHFSSFCWPALSLSLFARRLLASLPASLACLAVRFFFFFSSALLHSFSCVCAAMWNKIRSLIIGWLQAILFQSGFLENTGRVSRYFAFANDSSLVFRMHAYVSLYCACIALFACVVYMQVVCFDTLVGWFACRQMPANMRICEI